jgi:hypothetical protein
MVVSCFLVAGAASLCVTGCKPSSEKIAAREARIAQEIDALFAQIQTLQAEGQLAEAAKLVENGLSNPKYKSQRTRFFTQKIDLLLAQDQSALASELVLKAWRGEPELARSAFDRIHAYYRQRNANKDIALWCKSLLGLGADLPADLRAQVLDWQLTAALASQDLAESKAGLDSVVASLPAEASVALLQQALGALVDAKQLDFVQPLLAHLESKKLDSPLYRQLLATLKLRCVLAANDWTNFPPAFTACVAQLPDEQLLKMLRTVFAALQKNGKNDLVESASKQVIFTALEKTGSVNLASRIWVESGVAANKKNLPERLDALLSAKVSPIQVGNLFDRYFYEMVGNLDIIRSLCTIGERILSLCADENTVNNVKVKVLDGAFIVDNFDLAVTMLEQGIPGKDKAWHEMSLPKVKAHRAMAQKKPREAVQYFREFMNAWITSKQEEEFDPTSGIAYSREWILARNANRIAGILDSIPDKAEADKARDEAKAYFRIAIEKASKDAEATRLIKEETKNMGL